MYAVTLTAAAEISCFFSLTRRNFLNSDATLTYRWPDVGTPHAALATLDHAHTGREPLGRSYKYSALPHGVCTLRFSNPLNKDKASVLDSDPSSPAFQSQDLRSEELQLFSNGGQGLRRVSIRRTTRLSR